MRSLPIALLVFFSATSAMAAPVDTRLLACQGAVTAEQFTTNTSNGGQAIGASTPTVCALSLKASCANTVAVHVGGSALNASSAPGYTLEPCEARDVPATDRAKVFVDSGTTAATIQLLYLAGP